MTCSVNLKVYTKATRLHFTLCSYSGLMTGALEYNTALSQTCDRTRRQTYIEIYGVTVFNMFQIFRYFLSTNDMIDTFCKPNFIFIFQQYSFIECVEYHYIYTNHTARQTLDRPCYTCAIFDVKRMMCVGRIFKYLTTSLTVYIINSWLQRMPLHIIIHYISQSFWAINSKLVLESGSWEYIHLVLQDVLILSQFIDRRQ